MCPSACRLPRTTVSTRAIGDSATRPAHSFGIGAQAQGAFWVKVRVAGSTYTAYDFARKYCEAAWQNNDGDLPCPGSDGESKGYVIQIEDVTLENGNSQDDPGLMTVPKDVYNGSISGQYPAIKIRDGDHFQARVNCEHNSNSCNVIFGLYYQIGGGEPHEPGSLERSLRGQVLSDRPGPECACRQQREVHPEGHDQWPVQPGPRRMGRTSDRAPGFAAQHGDAHSLPQSDTEPDRNLDRKVQRRLPRQRRRRLHSHGYT